MDPYQIFNLGTECSFKVLFIKFASFSASTKIVRDSEFRILVGGGVLFKVGGLIKLITVCTPYRCYSVGAGFHIIKTCSDDVRL